MHMTSLERSKLSTTSAKEKNKTKKRENKRDSNSANLQFVNRFEHV